MDDNASRSKITATSNNLLAIASARNTCYVAFQQIASKLLQTEQSHGENERIMARSDKKYRGCDACRNVELCCYFVSMSWRHLANLILCFAFALYQSPAPTCKRKFCRVFRRSSIQAVAVRRSGSSFGSRN